MRKLIDSMTDPDPTNQPKLDRVLGICGQYLFTKVCTVLLALFQRVLLQ
ncbi:Uncharacterised protein [Legionella cincinnatiensis]|uniref:Uncharacterized protein n=1 Tax=Legionella cincinnatiensis TaxID=28085 RepID=A0A378IHI3_9GAMM|nr:Uncharacterised protein [Legionella cincinnatiensis]